MRIAQALKDKKTKVAVVGLGYVGLPLAVAFGTKVPTIGFDVKAARVAELKSGKDSTHEVTPEKMQQACQLEYTSDPARLRESQFIIVAVPTPVNKNKMPDLFCVESASEGVGKNVSRGAIVVFESTVYPGVTEDVCVPIMEKCSGLRCGTDFKVGYSPERINPGDKEHTLASIVKVVSGMDDETCDEVASVYELVVDAGVYRAQSIKCAEAAKVIENTQRDLNIALVNELAMIFNKMGIDTRDVLAAAGTKWNFIKMQPGLVGGHCIGVDPYYLTFKAQEIGHQPQVILAGRQINDSMGKYIAEQTVKKLIQAGKAVKDAKVMVMGITFKENVPDIRNSRVIDVVDELKAYGVAVMVSDPMANAHDVHEEYGVSLSTYDSAMPLDAIVLAVNHNEYKKMLSVDGLCKQVGSGGVVIDIKGMFKPEDFKGRKAIYWRL